ncbi:hypothetical protein BAQ48_06410 [Bacillus luti]|nr:hypothetical protein BAQ48_06410 [Bacillus luti]
MSYQHVFSYIFLQKVNIFRIFTLKTFTKQET